MEAFSPDCDFTKENFYLLTSLVTLFKGTSCVLLNFKLLTHVIEICGVPSNVSLQKTPKQEVSFLAMKFTSTTINTFQSYFKLQNKKDMNISKRIIVKIERMIKRNQELFQLSGAFSFLQDSFFRTVKN